MSYYKRFIAAAAASLALIFMIGTFIYACEVYEQNTAEMHEVINEINGGRAMR